MPFGGLLTVGLIGAGTNILGGVLGSSAAENAAAAQEQAAGQVENLAATDVSEANGLIASGAAGANSTLAGTYAQDLGLLTPYTGTGTNSLAMLNSLVNGGGFQA